MITVGEELKLYNVRMVVHGGSCEHTIGIDEESALLEYVQDVRARKPSIQRTYLLDAYAHNELRVEEVRVPNVKVSVKRSEQMASSR